MITEMPRLFCAFLFVLVNFGKIQRTLMTESWLSSDCGVCKIKVFLSVRKYPPVIGTVKISSIPWKNSVRGERVCAQYTA